MKHAHSLALTIVLIAVCQTHAQPAPIDPEAKKVLDRLVGEWTAHVLDKPSKLLPQGGKRTVQQTISPILKGRFILGREISADDNLKDLWLMTHDPQMKAYRSWWFSSDGYTQKSGGKWDAAAQTIEFRSDLGNGLTSSGGVRSIDNDRHIWTVTIRDGNGKLFSTPNGTSRAGRSETTCRVLMSTPARPSRRRSIPAR